MSSSLCSKQSDDQGTPTNGSLIKHTHKCSRKFRAAILLHVIFGRDCFRFAAMLGSFTALYKLILNSLPILFPPSTPIRPKDTQPDSPNEPLTPFVEFQAGLK